MNDKMKPKFKLRLLHEIEDIYDDNIDAVVDFDDGKSFGITFFTKKNIATLCEKWKKDGEIYGDPGECLNGAYFWSIDCVIVEKLENSFLEQVIADMLDQDERVFEKHFTKVRVKPKGFQLRLCHEITDAYDDNIDAVVDLDNGESFALTFITKKNVLILCDSRKNSGQCLNGSYFLPVGGGYMIVEKLEHSFLEQVIADMLYWNDQVFESQFTKIATV